MALTEEQLAELRRAVELERQEQGRTAQRSPHPPPPVRVTQRAAGPAAAEAGVAGGQGSEIPAPPVKTNSGRIWVVIIIVGIALWYFYNTNAVQQINREKQGTTTDPPPRPPPPIVVKQRGTTDVAAFVETVSNRNARSIEHTLAVATSELSSKAIEVTAIAAGRDFDFATHEISRNRKTARGLHDPVLDDLNQSGDVQRICDIMRSALSADLLDVEIAGNLAICLFRVGQFKQSLTLAMYALSMPRAAGKTGRTADWVTLAAAYAALGDQDRARGAMFVSLAIAPNVERRCKSAIDAVRKTFGPPLRDATVAMLQRVSMLNLSQAPECAIPTEW